MTSPPHSPRRGYLMFLPLVLVLLGAAAWTGVWFYAAARAEGVMDDWIAREAREGRSYACGERNVGGFPFRIEMRCDDLTIELRENDGLVVLTTRRVLAVAQIYQPDLIIAEATGPMTVALPGGEDGYVAEWTLLQASLRGRPRDLRRLSIVVDAPSVGRPGPAAAVPVARASRFEFHVLRGDVVPGDPPVYNLAGRTEGAVVSLVPALAERPFNAQTTAVLTGLDDLTARRPLVQRLRDWQARNGRLEISAARLQQDEALAVASGSLGLTTRGFLDGKIDLKLAGADHLTKLFLGEDANARNQAGLLAGLSLLSRAELEGRRAIAMPLAFRDGRVFFGPIPVAQTEPLF